MNMFPLQATAGYAMGVINYTDEDTYSCENMPTKYNKVWVM